MSTTLELARIPFTPESGKVAAAQKRFTPARMYRALHKRLKHEPDTQERIISAVLENACDRDSRWHGPAVELVLRGDPDLRAAMREEAQAVGLMPRIIIQGPQSAVSAEPATACIDVSAQYTSASDTEEILSDTRSVPGASADGGEIAALREQVSALTAMVAQLASIVASAQRGVAPDPAPGPIQARSSAT